MVDADDGSRSGDTGPSVLPHGSAIADRPGEAGEERLMGGLLDVAAAAGRGGWRAGIDTETAAPIPWALVPVDVCRRLVHQAGWSPDRYRQLLG